MKRMMFFFAAAAAIVSGCGYNPGCECGTLLLDRTDSLHAVQTVVLTDVKRLIPVEQDATLGGRLAVRTIGDVRTTQSHITEIVSHSGGGANDYLRGGECERFFESAGANLEEAKRGIHPLKKSYVVHSILAAMDDLAEAPGCKRKRCIVVSDLAENSDLFSVYSQKEIDLLEHHPEQLIGKINKAYPRTLSYEGIEVFFVHEGSMADDTRFYLMSKLLSDFLSSRSATVHAPVGSIDEVR